MKTVLLICVLLTAVCACARGAVTSHFAADSRGGALRAVLFVETGPAAIEPVRGIAAAQSSRDLQPKGAKGEGTRFQEAATGQPLFYDRQVGRYFYADGATGRSYWRNGEARSE